jgi:zinc transporter ZupT
MEARALTPLNLPLLPSLLSFLAHHHHHPRLAASSISFFGGIGIALPSHLPLHHRAECTP